MLVGHVLVLAAALTCLRLGWWQWGVAHATRGTVQNLGYALLWPVFAGAFIYMWLRFLHLESVRNAEQSETGTAAGGDGIVGAAGEVAGGDGVVGGRAEPELTVPATGTRGGVPGAAGDIAAEQADAGVEGRAGQPDADLSDGAEPRRRWGRPEPHEVYTVSVATVDDDDDDPELAAYNRALAALAEQDRRRAR